MVIVSDQRDRYNKCYEWELGTKTYHRSENVSVSSELHVKFQTSSEVLTAKLTAHKTIIKDWKSENDIVQSK